MIARVTLAVVLVGGLSAWAEEPPATDHPATVPLSLKVSERWAACNRGNLMCPAITPICDDPKIAKGEFDDKVGLVWVGVAPGSTLCSAGSAATKGALRALYRITVR